MVLGDRLASTPEGNHSNWKGREEASGELVRLCCLIWVLFVSLLVGSACENIH